MILLISVKRYRRTGSVHPVFHFVRTARAALVISRSPALIVMSSHKARASIFCTDHSPADKREIYQ